MTDIDSGILLREVIKMKIRQHRGGLDESLKTTVEIESTLAAIVDEISSKICRDVRPEEIHLQPIGNDSRIGWDTYMVSVDDYGVYGFTNGPVSNG